MTASVCPFCNGILPTLATPPQQEKIPCPRCGEPVPAVRWQVAAPSQAIREGWPPERSAAAPVEQVPGKRKTVLTIVAVMLAMAGAALGYALWTQAERRARDPHKVEKLAPIAFRKPLELSGLAYLPKGCQIVAGLQIAEMTDAKIPAGKELLAEPRPALLDWILKQIPRTTGQKLEELDHILLAVTFDVNFPQLVVVVKTRPKYSLEKIVEAVRPTKSSLHHGRSLYEFSLKPMGEAMLWCVEERTLLYVIRWTDDPTVEHLQALSEQPRDVKDLLPADVLQALLERLPKHQLAWAAGEISQNKTLMTWFPLLVGARADLAPLLKVKTFALGLEPVEGLTLNGHFHMADAAGSADLQRMLEGVKIDKAMSQKVVVDDRDHWVTWQLRGDVATMRELLDARKPEKK